MPAARYFAPGDTLEQKLQIERRLGSVKARKYFSILERFLSFKVSKREFDRICIATIGRENVPLHNHFLKSILKKASLSKTAVPRESKVEGSLNVKTPNGSNNLKHPCKDFPPSTRKGRSPNLRDPRLRHRPSPLVPSGKNNIIGCEDSAPKIHEQPLGPSGKNNSIGCEDSAPKILEQPLGPTGKNNSIRCEDSAPKIHEQRSIVDLQSAGSRLSPLSVEDVEEVDQDSEILNLCKRGPIQAPLAIPTYNKRPQKYSCQGLSSGTVEDTCQSIGQLPDTCSLTKRLEKKLEKEGFKTSMDAANLLNNALDAYLRRLIRHCLDLAASKSVNKFSGPIQPGLNELPMSRCVQKPIGSASASISDFRTAVELNPTILGEDWSLNLEKVCPRALEE